MKFFTNVVLWKWSRICQNEHNVTQESIKNKSYNKKKAVAQMGSKESSEATVGSCFVEKLVWKT